MPIFAAKQYTSIVCTLHFKISLKYKNFSEIPLYKRNPCGNDERIRRVSKKKFKFSKLYYSKQSLQFYFITRKFGQDLSGDTEQLLPLSSQIQPIAELNDCINLSM
jgi:hypothetical protein